MGMTLVSPPESLARNGPHYLTAFDNVFAPRVASWVRDGHELFWLAPKTEPPLTAAKVAAWPGRTGSPMLFWREGESEPLGYLELNPMPNQKGHLWMGHCVLAPNCRGVGLGRIMVGLGNDEAFGHRSAHRVSLVVFPGNVAAIRCYRAVGYLKAGDQLKHFATTGKQHVMRRMTIDDDRYQDRRDDGSGQA